jgi:FkbM family methyltransferase
MWQKLREVIPLWLRYTRLGIALGRSAADTRSRVLLAFLGATTLWRSGTGRFRGPIAVDVRLGPKTYRARLQTRTELSVLSEVALDDIYGDADDIPAETIVDLGANVGLATLRLLSTHPDARVIAVEADPMLAARLRENVAGLPVTVVAAAIAASSGERTFYRSDSVGWGNSLEHVDPVQTPVQVQAISLADLLSREGMETVDLLKMDVEGAEWEIFKAGVPSLVEAMVGETHARDDHMPEDFFALLPATMTVRSRTVTPLQATFVATREATGDAPG